MDANLLWVLTGLILMGTACGLTGIFLSLRGDVLSGDVMSHGVLPGVALAFMISGSRELYWLVPGACLSGWLTLEFRDWLVRKPGLRPDTAAAMALSVFYGLGVMLISHLRYSGQGSQSGLDRFLFGSAAAILPDEIIFTAVLAFTVLVLILLNYRSLVICIFHPEWARACGYRPERISRLLTFMTLICVVSGIQLVGVVLMASFLVAPGIAASGWVKSLGLRIPLSLLISATAISLGVYVSNMFAGMPTGPWVVVFLSVFAFAGLLRKYVLYSRKL